jgi:hypothetical protein
MTEPTAFEEINEHYLGQRLLYQENQPNAWQAFSTVNGSEMIGAVKGAFFRGVMLTLLSVPILVILIALGVTVLAVLVWCVAWTLPWFVKDHVYAGHWEFSLEDNAHLVEPAFALASAHLLDKQISAAIEPRRVRSTVAGRIRYYLTVRQDRYICYVGMLSYGSDLFVGWSMWREQRPYVVIWYWLVGIAQSFVGKSSQFHEIVRADPARAMREAVHNATRAGVEGALDGLQATIEGTFGQELAELTSDDGHADVSPVDLTEPRITRRPVAPAPASDRRHAGRATTSQSAVRTTRPGDGSTPSGSW